MTPQDETATERLMRVAAAAKIPDAVRAAVHGPPPDPAAGQIWCASWDGIVELLVLVAVVDTTVTVLPISLEPDFADGDTYVLPASTTSFEVAVAVWAGLARDIPMRVLDQMVATTSTPPTAGWPATVAGARPGRTPGMPHHPTLELGVYLKGVMGHYAAATWAPKGTGQLTSWLGEAKVDVTLLANLLDVPPNEAFAIRRGQRPITPEQAHVLQAVLGREPAELVEANPALPPELIRDLDHPRWRPHVRRLAEQENLSGLDAWRTAAFGSFALAARASGASPEGAWSQRLERYFQAVLGTS